ncbi:MAG: phosphoglucomutase/phosphomannomutase family protein [Chloroflexi bacterium]|nr:phosphoglucomutase/phosphomannomutase family protein [Chloroflexota bacterium]
MIKFGTDGWRAIIADEFTFQNVRYCAQGMAEYLMEAGTALQGIVIGYDTRFASERFANAAAEVMAGNGIKVYLSSTVVPTQVVSFGALSYRAAGAIVITASHNPPEWNGFKIKTSEGASAPPEVETSIEKRLPDIIDQNRVKIVPLEQGLSEGIIEYVDLYPAYAEQLGKMVDLESIRQAGFKIAVDPMFGAGAGYIKDLVGSAKTEILEIHAERNPAFPGMKQPEPIASNLTELAGFVRENGVDVGVATDGDADRVGIVDENGQPLTPLQIFGLLAFYLLEIRGQRGAIVKTVTTTGMLNKLGELYDVPVFETKVGFKHVAPVMAAEGALVGGEESSGFGYRGHIPERDGVLSALFILDLMAKTGKKPSELIEYLYSKVGPHHYHRSDIEFPAADRENIIRRLTDNMPELIGGVGVVEVNTVDGYHFRLADGTWLLMRFSGTEPLLRIYSEAESLDRAEALVAEGRQILQV